MKLLIGTKEYINNSIENLNCEIINNEYGKPLDKKNKIFFNKSHSNDLNVALIGDKICGIDIEIIREYNDLIAKKICSDNEYNFLKKSSQKDYDYTLLWVLKESYLKCIGIGLLYPLKKIDFVKNNKINNRKKDFFLEIINYKNYIISICRKD